MDKAERKPVTYREAVFAPINRQKERVVTFAIHVEIDTWHAKTTAHNSKKKCRIFIVYLLQLHHYMYQSWRRRKNKCSTFQFKVSLSYIVHNYATSFIEASMLILFEI